MTLYVPTRDGFHGNAMECSHGEQMHKNRILTVYPFIADHVPISILPFQSRVTAGQLEYYKCMWITKNCPAYFVYHSYTMCWLKTIYIYMRQTDRLTDRQIEGKEI